MASWAKVQLLLPLCVSERLYYTNKAYAPSASLVPDVICQQDGEAQNLTGPFRAIAFTASVRNLLDIFSGRPIYSTDNKTEIAGAPTSELFAGVNSSAVLITTADGVRLLDDALYWSGAASPSGSQAGSNCGDFTGGSDEFSWVGSVGASICFGQTQCTNSLPFLCASDAVPAPSKPDPSSSAAYLFMTNATYTPNDVQMDPDIICREEGIRSNHSLLGPNVTYQALFMMRYRQSLVDMFSASTSIRDLDENLIATNASDLFSQPISRAALRDAFGVTKADIETDFWTGASTSSGDISSATNCGDFTQADPGLKTYTGRLGSGLSFSEVFCDQSARFLCAARVLPVKKAVVSKTAAYIFATDPYRIAANVDPDRICQEAGFMSSHALLGRNQTYQALAFTSQRQDLWAMFAQSTELRDLDGNFLSSVANAKMSQSISATSLQTVSGKFLDATSTLIWTGANISNELEAAENCADFTDPSASARIGSPKKLFLQSTSCTLTLPFLCAAGVLPLQKPRPKLNSSIIFLSNATKNAANGIFDPDMVCQSEGLASENFNLRNGGNFSYFALLFYNSTYNFRLTTAAVSELYDLENNVLLADTNVVTFFLSPVISRRAIPRAVGSKADAGQKFWVSITTSQVDQSCKSRSLLSSSTVPTPCSQSLPIMCIAIPTALPPRQELCNRTLVQQGLQLDCLTVTIPSSFNNNRSKPFVIISPIVNITQIANSSSSGFVFTLPIAPFALNVIKGILTQRCQGASISCQWQDPVSLEFQDSGCSASTERVDMGSGIVGTQCSCSHLTVFALVLQTELKLVPLCQADVADYVLIAFYLVLVFILLIQVTRLILAKLCAISLVFHIVLLLIATLRIAYLIAKPIIHSFGGLVFLSLLPSALSMGLFIHMLIAWVSLQMFAMSSSPFAKFRIPFLIILSFIFLITIAITIAVAVTEQSQQIEVVIIGSYVLATLYGIICLLVFAAGLGLDSFLRGLDQNSSSAPSGRKLPRRRFLLSTLGLSVCLFATACLWIAAVQEEILSSATATLATSSMFFVLDCFGLFIQCILFSGGVKSISKNEKKLPLT